MSPWRVSRILDRLECGVAIERRPVPDEAAGRAEVRAWEAARPLRFGERFALEYMGEGGHWLIAFWRLADKQVDAQATPAL